MNNTENIHPNPHVSKLDQFNTFLASRGPLEQTILSAGRKFQVGNEKLSLNQIIKRFKECIDNEPDFDPSKAKAISDKIKEFKETTTYVEGEGGWVERFHKMRQVGNKRFGRDEKIADIDNKIETRNYSIQEHAKIEVHQRLDSLQKNFELILPEFIEEGLNFQQAAIKDLNQFQKKNSLDAFPGKIKEHLSELEELINQIKRIEDGTELDELKAKLLADYRGDPKLTAETKAFIESEINKDLEIYKEVLRNNTEAIRQELEEIKSKIENIGKEIQDLNTSVHDLESSIAKLSNEALTLVEDKSKFTPQEYSTKIGERITELQKVAQSIRELYEKIEALQEDPNIPEELKEKLGDDLNSYLTERASSIALLVEHLTQEKQLVEKKKLA